MLEIATVLSDVNSLCSSQFKGKNPWGNAWEGTLQLDHVEISSEPGKLHRIYFKFDHDYSTDEGIGFNVDVVKKVLEKNGLKVADGYDGKIFKPVCYMEMTPDVFSSFVVDVIGLYYGMVKDPLLKSYGNAHKNYTGKRTNVSENAYSVTWDDIDDGFYVPIVVRDSNRFGGCAFGIFEMVTKNLIETARTASAEFGDTLRSKVKSVLMEQNNLADKNLPDFFVYEVCNDHSVIIKLKRASHETKDLLRFDGFVGMYDTFKIEYYKTGETVFMMARFDISGNEKPDVVIRDDCKLSPDVEKMLSELEKCIQIECLIFKR